MSKHVFTTIPEDRLTQTVQVPCQHCGSTDQPVKMTIPSGQILCGPCDPGYRTVAADVIAAHVIAPRVASVDVVTGD